MLSDCQPLSRPLAVGLFLGYATAQLFLSDEYWGTVSAVRTEARTEAQLRLPTLYLCPAGRRQRDRLRRWVAYGCTLQYRGRLHSCEARERRYDGYPEDFRGGSGLCLEFTSQTLLIDKEWTPAWNELWLHASYEEWNPGMESGMSAGTGLAPGILELEEVEVGYRCLEWDLQERWRDSSYASLFRVPSYDAAVHDGDGVATRAFLGEEQDEGKRDAGAYWYAYGASQVKVRNATPPPHALPSELGDGGTVHGPLKAVAVVLTIEDFAVYYKRFTPRPWLYPTFTFLGQAAGVAGLLMAVSRPSKRPHVGSVGTPEEGSPREPRYREITTAEDTPLTACTSDNDGGL